MKIQVAPDTAHRLEKHADEIATAASSHLLEHQPDLERRFGEDALQVWTKHLRQRVLEICAALTSGDVGLFVSRVTWSRTAMLARDVESRDLEVSLASLHAAILSFADPEARPAVAACIEAARKAVAAGPISQNPSTSTLDPGLMAERIALRYVQAVIAGNVIAGMSIVLDAIDAGVSAADAIAKILLPAQHEVGRLWHINEISIAEEHLVTSTTQRLMAVLADRATRAPDRGLTAVAAAVAGNNHDVGIRALTYLLEFDGWRTIYLGSDVPKSELPAAIKYFEPDIVLLSLALSSQIPVLRRTISRIRGKPGNDVKIMVGGNGFRGAPDLWRKLGADGYARTSEEAVAVAVELVGPA